MSSIELWKKFGIDVVLKMEPLPEKDQIICSMLPEFIRHLAYPGVHKGE